MKTKLINFFVDSAKVFTNPDELFYVKSQSRSYGGIATSIFYAVFLALIIGIFTQDITVTAILMICGVVGVLLYNIIHTIITTIFAWILGGRGSILSLFNLISYTSAIDILLILSLALIPYHIMVIIPAIILISLWKMIIVCTAVNTEYEIGFGKSFLSAYGILIIILTVLVGVL